MDINTITSLRENLYNAIDQVIKTGVPIELKRKGKRVKIILDEATPDKFKNLKPHRTINGDPDELINIDSSKWDEAQNL